MTIIFEARGSDSPYIDTVTQGLTASDGCAIRPAESCWHLVFSKYEGIIRPFLVGPWTTSGRVTYREGAEIVWIKFKLGAFMPHLPPKQCLNQETLLPEATSHSFWLNSAAWQIPSYDNAETFVEQLARAEVLMRDPVVTAALDAQRSDVPSRTLRHRFLQATGQSYNHIYQVERAQQAAALLRQGVSIPDTVFELGYYDQAHLTRALKQWIGYTPGQLVPG